jgi:hypothetical protein
MSMTRSVRVLLVDVPLRGPVASGSARGTVTVLVTPLMVTSNVALAVSLPLDGSAAEPVNRSVVRRSSNWSR